MAKKIRPGDLRKMQQAQKKEEYSTKENERKAEAQAKVEAQKILLESKQKEETKKKAETQRQATGEKGPEFKEPKRKSNAKVAGLKSTFVVGDNLIMTSFGKRNATVIEKEIKGEEITSINNPESYAVLKANTKNQYQISGKTRPVTGFANDPRSKGSKVGTNDDVTKEKLEKKYFGKCFNDNVHIQLIYNILDIEKILAVHSNNIIYALNNLQRNNNDMSDIMGNFGFKFKYGNFINPKNEKEQRRLDEFNEFAKGPYIGYYSSAFLVPDSKDKTKKRNRRLEEIYDILCMLGGVRQYCAHGADVNAERLYDLTSTLDESKKRILDELYNSAILNLNKDFAGMNYNNYAIIFKALSLNSNEKRKDIIAKFYDFVVKKSFKNIGFSIKTLREVILKNPTATVVKDKKYDTMRSKLYRILDFIIYLQYIDNEEEIDSFVESLRGTKTALDKKEIYEHQADIVWNKIKDTVLNGLLPQMTGANIKALEKDGLSKDEKLFVKQTISDVEIKASNDYFCKLIYLLTLFLDGKEINDLLTTLINKFDNIASFNNFIKESKLEGDYLSEYSIFERASEISATLRIINSFARMTKSDASTKKIMFVEAAQMLGDSSSKEELETYFDDLLDKKKGIVNGKKDNGLRNFIINNVIESSRFKYLVRYSTPTRVRNIANNKEVVMFVLNGIPDAQIDKYFKSCGCDYKDQNKQREALADVIFNVRFANFEKVNQKAKAGTEEAKEKDQFKAIITLYLTVLYLLVKNLVNVNSRYFMAFHCYERDTLLNGYEIGKFEGKDDYRKLAIETINNNLAHEKALCPDPRNSLPSVAHRYYRKKRVIDYLTKNLDNLSNDKTINLYRNNVEHLSAVREMDKYVGDVKKFDSYFELYHYLMQRKLKDFSASQKVPVDDPKANAYYEYVINNGAYSKDFVKALNMPFAYNLARYKNLSIGALFDKNNPPEKTKKIDLEN